MKFQTHAAKQIHAYKKQAEFRSSVPYPAQPKEKLTVGGLEMERPLVVTGQGEYRHEWTPNLAETEGIRLGWIDFAIVALAITAGIIAGYALITVFPMVIKAL